MITLLRNASQVQYYPSKTSTGLLLSANVNTKMFPSFCFVPGTPSRSLNALLTCTLGTMSVEVNKLLFPSGSRGSSLNFIGFLSSTGGTPRISLNLVIGSCLNLEDIKSSSITGLCLNLGLLRFD